jgi:hypothetical protein
MVKISGAVGCGKMRGLWKIAGCSVGKEYIIIKK